MLSEVPPRSAYVGKWRAVEQAAGREGPHNLPYGQQERCVVEGRGIDGGGPCTAIAIRDRSRQGRVLYPHGEAGLGVLIPVDAAQVLADRLGDSS